MNMERLERILAEHNGGATVRTLEDFVFAMTMPPNFSVSEHGLAMMGILNQLGIKHKWVSYNDVPPADGQVILVNKWGRYVVAEKNDTGFCSELTRTGHGRELAFGLWLDFTRFYGGSKVINCGRL